MRQGKSGRHNPRVSIYSDWRVRQISSSSSLGFHLRGNGVVVTDAIKGTVAARLSRATSMSSFAHRTTGMIMGFCEISIVD